MLKFLKMLPLLALFASPGAMAAGDSQAGSGADTPTAAVQQFYDTLLGVMKDAQKLGFQGRFDRLKPAIERAYNLPMMARLSIGPQWQTLTPEDQQKLTAAFNNFTVATYAGRFDGYSGERFEVASQTTDTAAGTVVSTKLIKSNGDPVSLNYLLRQTDGKWQIIDVFLSGTVSELATRRSEFTAVLRRDGPQALLDLLTKRVADQQKS